jgi:hypothetical protein
MFKRSLLVVMLIAALAAGPLPALAQDEEPTPQEAFNISTTLAELGHNDLTLQGRETSRTVWLTLPHNWWLEQDIQVDLVYTASALLEDDRSGLTVTANDQEVASFRPVSDGTKQVFTFTIPTELVYQGSGFLLGFEGNLRTTDATCESMFLPEQWLRILDDTTLTLAAIIDETPPVLGNLSSTLLQDTVLDPTQVIFVLPDNPDSTALTAAAQVAARLNKQVSSKVFEFETRTTGTLTNAELEDSHLIVVGLPDDQPLLSQVGEALPAPLTEDGFLTATGMAAPPEYGVVQILLSPWNIARRMMVVSAGNAQGLSMVGQAFASDEMFAQLDGRFTFVNNIPETDEETVKGPWLDNQTTFAQMGYEHQTVNGLRISEVSYYTRWPAGWVLRGDAQLTLDVAYSPNVMPGSYIEVSIGNTPVGVARLEQSVGQRQFIFDLPAGDLQDEMLLPQSVQIRLQVANYMPIAECQTIDPSLIWTRILNSSKLTTPHDYAALPDLLAFPYPFVSDQPAAPVTLVLPDEPEEPEIEQALAVAAVLGRYALRSFDLRVAFADDVTENEYTDSHLIVLGERTRQPWVNTFLSASADLEVSSTGLLHEIISPWNMGRVVLIVSGQDTDGLASAVGALELVPVVDQPGTTAVIEAGESPRVVDTADEAMPQIEPALTPDQ